MNPEAPLLDGLQLRDSDGENKVSYSEVWFQKEKIGLELSLSTSSSSSFGPLQPTYSISQTSKNGLWIGAGFLNAISLTNTSHIRFSFLPGVYSKGDDVDLGGWLMFKSGVGFEYELNSNWSLSISFDHRSSGDIWEYNPGMETFQFSVIRKLSDV